MVASCDMTVFATSVEDGMQHLTRLASYARFDIGRVGDLTIRHLVYRDPEEDSYHFDNHPNSRAPQQRPPSSWKELHLTVVQAHTGNGEEQLQPSATFNTASR